NQDVYVVATAGGAARRITYNPASDEVRGWTPDGKILFTSNRMGAALGWGMLPPRLFEQAMDAVVATPIDLPTGWDGSLSADAQRLAYMPIVPANEIWK